VIVVLLIRYLAVSRIDVRDEEHPLGEHDLVPVPPPA
jgi:hypothetical protein